jgi:hypothetical protein
LKVVSDLVFADLFAFASGSLGFVRVYRLDGRRAVVLLLEPQDNPGRSSVNAAEDLIDDLQRAFGALGELRVFVRFLDTPTADKWIELIAGRERVEFQRHPLDHVDSLLGHPLAPEPPNATCARLGGAGHPLLALVPPPEPERNRLDDLAVVSVADLPWPHNPARCQWHERYQLLQGLYPSGCRAPAIGAHWFLTLDEAAFAACPYHEADWKRIASVAVTVFHTLRDEDDVDTAIAAVRRALGDSAEATWCVSLYLDPLVWSPGHATVVNGQHRSCALKASGAPLCVIDVDGRYVAEPVVGDPRRRAASTVASYWAEQASR